MNGPPRVPPHDFSRLLSPRAVAVVGASENLARIGGQPLRLLTEFGFRGGVYPVNPRHEQINGLQCYPTVAAVPKPCDVAIVALAAQSVPAAIAQCGEAGIPYAVVFSSGFSEVGPEGRALQQQLTTTARAHGVRVIGPNCLGILNVKEDIRTGFGGSMRQSFLPGPFAMVTQSGGLGFGLVTTAAFHGIGFNYAITTGNEADTTMLDLCAHLLERDDVEGIFLLMEGVADGTLLRALGSRALALGKPIVVWKIGNTAVGLTAAASHSSRLISGYPLFQAAFRDGGFIEVRDTDDLMDTLKLLRARKLPRGRGVGIVSPSGGAGVLYADLCSDHGLEVTRLAAETTAELRTFMAPFASTANPVDVTASGNNDNYASFSRVVGTVLADPGVDQIIVRTPSSSEQPLAESLIALARASAQPMVIDWPVAPGEKLALRRFYEEHGIACLLSPERGVRAMAALTGFAAKCRDHRPEAAAPQRPIDRQDLALPAAGTLGEHASKKILAAYGIPCVREVLLSAAEIARLAHAPLPFPLALKVESADLPHKTEAGAVRLGIRSLEELKTAAREIEAAALRYRPGARIDGLSVQEMASGLEVIAGAVRDDAFGPVVVFGLGGIYTELLRDTTHAFAPFDVAQARAMIDRIRGRALLHGFRGQPALDVAALAEVLSRLSWLAADHRDRIAEIDVNPIFVRAAGAGVVAADALVVLS